MLNVKRCMNDRNIHPSHQDADPLYLNVWTFLLSFPYDVNAVFFYLNVYKVKNLKLIADW